MIRATAASPQGEGSTEILRRVLDFCFLLEERERCLLSKDASKEVAQAPDIAAQGIILGCGIKAADLVREYSGAGGARCVLSLEQVLPGAGPLHRKCTRRPQAFLRPARSLRCANSDRWLNRKDHRRRRLTLEPGDLRIPSEVPNATRQRGQLP